MTKFKILKFCLLACSIYIFLLTFSFCEPEIALVINGDKIYKDEFDHALAGYERSYRRYFGDNIDAALNEKMKKELVDDLVDRQLYMQEAQRRGITCKTFAGEEEIDELLMDWNATSEEKGLRDRAEQVILAEKTREILPSKVIAAMKDEVNLSDKELLDEYLNRTERMKVSYIKVDPVALANNMYITEDEIKDYYQRNLEIYRVPAVERYWVLHFDPEDYRWMVSVSDKMMLDYYNDHLGDYKIPKMAKVKYVLFRDKEYLNNIYQPGVNLRQYYEANIDQFIEPAEVAVSFISMKKPCPEERVISLEDDLRQKKPFSELAKEYSDDNASAQNEGDLGYVKEGTLKEPFNGIAFNLKPGEVSNVIETEKGYYVIAVRERKESRVRPFEEVAGEIEEKLLDEQARPLALSDAKRFRVEARKFGFEEAAKKSNKTIYETDYFKASDRIPVIGRNNLFTYIALNLASGEMSGVIDYDGGYAVLEGVDVRQGGYMPFSEVSDNIERKIFEENSMEFANSAAKQTLNLISDGVSLESLPARMSVSLSLLQVSSSAEVPVDAGKIVRKDDGYYIISFRDKIPSYVPDITQVSREAAASAILEKGDEAAKEKAEGLLSSSTTEGGVVTDAFLKSDYMIGSEYMRPFIEQCFLLGRGDKKIINSLGKYYVVKVIERSAQLAGYEEESIKIRSQLLREKRENRIQDWLKQEREKADIRISI